MYTCMYMYVCNIYKNTYIHTYIHTTHTFTCTHTCLQNHTPIRAAKEQKMKTYHGLIQFWYKLHVYHVVGGIRTCMYSVCVRARLCVCVCESLTHMAHTERADAYADLVKIHVLMLCVFFFCVHVCESGLYVTQ